MLGRRRTVRAVRARRGRRYLLWTLVGALLVAGGLGGVVVWQNTYDLREERVVLRHHGHRLEGVLARPPSVGGPFGLVVFVHGDGPVDATHDTFYRPLWEAFARAGYASLSFSKPGVAGSEGDWLDQSMDDRAEETLAAVAWARGRPGIDGRRIGLWGASQAGWVLPKVAAKDRAYVSSSPSPRPSTGCGRAATTCSPYSGGRAPARRASRRRCAAARRPCGC
ncbi:alpha/beta hydrolase family protein [Streptomyces longwoodensis]|uniref:alpha/beta hydrolase family protein n=1 Tax=Streptomyces longwoodensis TaxID=68231 RepID=UPI0034038886